MFTDGCSSLRRTFQYKIEQQMMAKNSQTNTKTKTNSYGCQRDTAHRNNKFSVHVCGYVKPDYSINRRVERKRMKTIYR
jgi:Pyruvate/2-oxoacid:ferredoxin oxidoreductase delta subunit